MAKQAQAKKSVKVAVEIVPPFQVGDLVAYRDTPNVLLGKVESCENSRLGWRVDLLTDQGDGECVGTEMEELAADLVKYEEHPAAFAEGEVIPKVEPRRIDEPSKAELKKAAKTHAKAATKAKSKSKAEKQQDATKAFAFPLSGVPAEAKVDKKSLTKKALKAAAQKRLTKPGVIVLAANIGLIRITAEAPSETSDGHATYVDGVTVMGDTRLGISATNLVPATKKQVDEFRRLSKKYKKPAKGVAQPIAKEPKVSKTKAKKATKVRKVEMGDGVEHPKFGFGIVRTSEVDGKASVLFKGDDLAASVATGDDADPRLVDVKDLTVTRPVNGEKIPFEDVQLFGAFLHKQRTFVKVSKSNGIAAVIRGLPEDAFAMLATPTSKIPGSAVQRFKKSDKVELYAG
jgi:hypothetical protein